MRLPHNVLRELKKIYIYKSIISICDVLVTALLDPYYSVFKKAKSILIPPT